MKYICYWYLIVTTLLLLLVCLKPSDGFLGMGLDNRIRIRRSVFHAKKAKHLISNELLNSIQEKVKTLDLDSAKSSESHSPQSSQSERETRAHRPHAHTRFSELSTQPQFVSVKLDKVNLWFGNQHVLSDLSFVVSTGDKVALMGPNGIGKTSVLQLIRRASEDMHINSSISSIVPTSGTIQFSPSRIRIAMLGQEFEQALELNATLLENMFSVFAYERDIINELNRLEQELTVGISDESQLMDAITKVGHLREVIDSSRASSIRPRIEKILSSVGFVPSDYDSKVSTFSGGWKMKIGLAKLLLQDPNVLLLDEPTNHLDLDSVLWLESFLRSLTIPMIVVSHDREFVDQVCNKIVDMQGSDALSFSGNYSQYVVHRDTQLESWRTAYESQQRHIREEEVFIRKHSNDAHMTQTIKAKQMALDRLRSQTPVIWGKSASNPPTSLGVGVRKAGRSDQTLIREPPRERKFRFRFAPAAQSSKQVLDIMSVSHGYCIGELEKCIDAVGGGSSNGDVVRWLFKDINLSISRGDRIGFVGDNGVGKSTFMRLIASMETPLKGCINQASSNIKIGYYNQNQAESLDLDCTVLETIQMAANEAASIAGKSSVAAVPAFQTMTEIRSLLGQFMFKGDAVDKKLRVLSGGERARVALCRLLVSPHNLLLLDEPTNHLDIISKDVLEEALLHYEGTLVIVSHDRHFMSKLVKTIYEFVGDGRIIQHDCDFYEYMTSRRTDAKQFSTKITNRYVDINGQLKKIGNAELIEFTEINKPKKNFGGSGVSSGNKFKGIKNAKRFMKR